MEALKSEWLKMTLYTSATISYCDSYALKFTHARNLRERRHNCCAKLDALIGVDVTVRAPEGTGCASGVGVGCVWGG